MKKVMMMLAATLLIGAGANATEPVAHDHEGKHKCIMFGAEKWQKLGLTEQQRASVAEIQASCKREYTAAVNAGRDASVTVDAHEARLRTVLTPEQYETWKGWCERKAQ